MRSPLLIRWNLVEPVKNYIGLAKPFAETKPLKSPLEIFLVEQAAFQDGPAFRE
jgi:hypothetical protein